jgi:hypothetical protein
MSLRQWRQRLHLLICILTPLLLLSFDFARSYESPPFRERAVSSSFLQRPALFTSLISLSSTLCGLLLFELLIQPTPYPTSTVLYSIVVSNVSPPSGEAIFYRTPKKCQKQSLEDLKILIQSLASPGITRNLG